MVTALAKLSFVEPIPYTCIARAVSDPELEVALWQLLTCSDAVEVAVEQSVHHKMLVAQYSALFTLAERRGIEVPGAPTPQECESMDGVDLQRWIRMLRDVLRTPSGDN